MYVHATLFSALYAENGVELSEIGVPCSLLIITLPAHTELIDLLLGYPSLHAFIV